MDLALLKGIRVDPVRRTARAQAGVLLGELDRETQAFGLATPSGIVTHTGLAGLTLGGGIGWLMRKYGLSIDNLISVDVVTAEGELVTASEDVNADLFWGIRGGGGNFGIVTEFEFRLHPVGPIVYGGLVAWPMEQSPELMRFYRDWITDVPDELTTAVIHRWLPAAADDPGRAARPAGGGGRRQLRRTGRGRREGGRAAQGLRTAAAGHVYADAVPRAAVDVRPELPARPVVLHAGV